MTELDQNPSTAKQSNGETVELFNTKQTPRSNRFNQADLATLIDLWNTNTPVREIAELMGRTYNSVRNKVAKLQRENVITPRDVKNQVATGFIETTAAKYNLPIDTVTYFTTLFGKGAHNIMAATEITCEAWSEQNGECYYLRGRVKLTCDTSPSGIVPMYTADGRLMLVCRAVASVRKSMSHAGFVSMCKHIANVFEME